MAFRTSAFRFALILVIASGAHGLAAQKRPSSEPLDWIEVAKDGRGFVRKTSGQPFVPWGFNYDHDEGGRLIEDYWVREWAKVRADFREMRALGANVVRVHLQLGRFMKSPTEPNANALRQLRWLLAVAERQQIHIDLTGLGCYHKADVPAWYDALSEADRWAVQARFWTEIARACAGSPAIFCYDLMNEPVAPAGTGRGDSWLGPPFGGKHFVQWIALETKGRERPAIARAWIRQLTAAIREVDKRHLITVGLVNWSLDRPQTLYSGFAPEQIAPELDFLAVHLYPEKGKVAESIETLKGFAVGKPLIIEETFPLKCSVQELGEFIKQSRPVASGWIGFYWGRTAAEYRKSKELADAMMLGWLEYFQRESPLRAPPVAPNQGSHSAR